MHLSNKNKQICFVLHSVFTIFATDNQKSCISLIISIVVWEN